MADIVLSAINAKYIHAAFGLRYLLANLGRLRDRAALLEFDINQRPVDILERILAHHPKIIGLGVYIWNARVVTDLVTLLKRVRPDVTVILGGPEVSYETEVQAVCRTADHVICGEADLKFAEVCAAILEGHPPSQKVIQAELPEFSQLALPYDLYSPDDIAHRILYVEASRGCPFSCEFCLSSLEIPVRQAPLEVFLSSIERMLQRGARQLKFVDRTFNLNARASSDILEFLLERYQPGMFFHFEMVPDRFPESLRGIVRRFPPGSLQFEVGIQSFNPEVGALIQRRQDYAKLEENLRFLRESTGVHVHADLIIGLPGETVESFAAGFDRLVALRPHEIQVGILKKLRGTPISRHDGPWEMVYSPEPPYEILQNKLIGFGTMQRLRRFARYWDLISNSGNFGLTLPLLWQAPGAPPASAFQTFLEWSDWLHQQTGRTDSIALARLAGLWFEYLTKRRHLDPANVALRLWQDYSAPGRRDVPPFLAEYLPKQPPVRTSRMGSHLNSKGIPKRQARHLPST
jgi:radical SAM superfamily enzyme YgiQ (UPF0313 family)